MAKFEPGETFGRLTVTRWDSASSVQCICSCGTAFVGVAGNMRSGATQSCGCIRKEKNNHVTHGHTGSLAHKRWRSMRARCLNKNASNYPQYGGSGIGICEEWDDFERFLADMGECPGEGFTLDREDGNKGYSPGNCRWATRVQQARNQSTNKLITFRGEALGLSEWAEKLGIKSQTIQNRLRKGWTIDEALGTTGDARAFRKSRAE
ncbi:MULTISPECIES: hypothetical protein [Pseudomonas]|nr:MULTISPECIES: hypothetical protein [Pseudomonas]